MAGTRPQRNASLEPGYIAAYAVEMDATRRTALLLGVGALVAGSAAPAGLVAERERARLAQAAEENALAERRAARAAVIADRSVPADALWLHPAGDDNAAGTRDEPRLTPLPGRFNVGEGTHRGAFWEIPRGPRTTIASRGLVLDGAGSVPIGLVAAGVTDLLGDLVVQHYVPTVPNNGSNAPVYFGGESAGSLVDGLTVRSSSMAAIGFQNRIVLRNFTAEDIGYSAIMGTQAGGSVLENLTVSRVNRGGFAQDGQLGALKITASPGLRVRGFTLRDCPVANGFWLDVGCQDFELHDVDIDGSGAAGQPPMGHGIHPEIGVGGMIRSFVVTGAGGSDHPSAGLMVLDSSDIDAADGDLRGNFVGAFYRRDNRTRGGTGSDPRNGSPEVNRFDTLGNRLRNVDLDGPNQLWAYAESDAPDPSQTGESMFAELGGLWFGPSEPGGRQIRMDRHREVTPAQLSTSRPAFGPNYSGADVRAARRIRVPLTS